MRVKCIKKISELQDLTLNKTYDVISATPINGTTQFRIVDDAKDECHYNANQFEVIEEPAQIIDLNGIQTEPFTNEQKKVIAVEKDCYKVMLWNDMLASFKTADELQRIALLEIFEEMGYPQTDMVKLYRKFQNEL